MLETPPQENKPLNADEKKKKTKGANISRSKN